MKRFFSTLLIIVIAGSFFSSCKKDLSCENCGGTANRVPVAHAGDDRVVSIANSQVILDGSRSTDPDNNITSYRWNRIAGSSNTALVNSNSAQAQVINLAPGLYSFELVVTDAGGLWDRDTVNVVVDNPFVNQPPVADAGPNLEITLPMNSIFVSGASSIDPDNNISNYAWRKITGPQSINIVSPNNIYTHINNLTAGTYEVELRVTDSDGLFDLDTLLVVVNAAPSIGNVIFYFPDPTGSMPPVTTWYSDNNGPVPIMKVQITGFGERSIHGVWSTNWSPRCPIETDYYAEPEMIAAFNLPPGTYNWEARSIAMDFTGYPPQPGPFVNFMSTVHTRQGTITVNAGNNCLLVPVVY